MVSEDCASPDGCAKTFSLTVDPEDRTVRATTVKDTAAGLLGSGSSAVSQLAFLDFNLDVIANGTTEVTYACCARGVPRYVRITGNPASADILAAVGVYGPGGVELNLYVPPNASKQTSVYVKYLPYYCWIAAIIADVIFVALVKFSV